MKEKFVSINQVPGGFIVNTDGNVQVVTSLNKAIKVVRDHLGAGADEAAE